MAASERPSDISGRSWGLVTALIGGLIVAIVVAGIVAIVENERVQVVTERALSYDVEIEDEGDDLRVAVLNLRHYHRNIVFGGPAPSAVEDFDRAYAELGEEIGELEQIGLAELNLPQPARIRELAEHYYADFRPAVERSQSDPAAFQIASDEGLRRIEEMDDAAQEIDGLGEQLAAASLSRVEAATTTERFVLIALVGGAGVVGVILALAATRVLARLRTSYAREQAATAELTRALRTKTDFIADASHELRTPLTVIRGNAEIALSGAEERTRREALSEIAAEATRMSKLVEDLLFLARSDAGVPPLEREYVPVRWLMSRIRKPAEVLAQHHGACLRVELDAEGYLEVDPGRVEQAVLIVVDNAAKHSPPGACVALVTRVRGGDLAIAVADTGLGIPPTELPFIFDRFYQVGPRRTRKQNGSGLGLAIAKSIVESHGGQIAVESQPGQGTRVVIRLPLGAAPEPEAETTATPRLISA